MFLFEPYLVTAPSGSTTRSTTATYIDAAGVLRHAAINEIRPIIEALAATNLVSSSNSFSAVGSSVNLSTTTAGGPDATTDATKCVSSGSGTHAVKGVETSALTVGLRYGASVFVQKASPYLKRAVVKVYSGTGGSAAELGKVLVNVDGAAVVSSTGVTDPIVVDCADGYVRVEFTFIAASTSGNSNHHVRVYLDDGTGTAAESTSFSGSSTKWLRVFGCQIEANLVSSYIPTAGATVTRAADVSPAAVSGVSDLISTNVPITDYAAWAVGTAYVTGNKVIVTGQTSIYECVTGCTGVNPSTDTTGKWSNIGRVNAWKMFDGFMSTATAYADEINVSIRPGAKVDCIALFGLVASSVRVTVTDTIEGLVYDQLVSTMSHVAEVSWYSYYFSPQLEQNVLVLSDLPRTATCTIGVQIALPGATAECSMLLVGSKDEIGTCGAGVAFGIEDYSAKTTDTNGNITVQQRAYADRVSYQILIDSADNARIKKRLAALRATACVFVADPDFPETVCYGYYKSFFPVLQSAERTDCQLEIEGLT